MTIRTAFLSAFLLSVTLPLVAQETSAQAEPAKKRRVHPMAAVMANPAAWNEPEFFIAIVNEGGVVDSAWLTDFISKTIRYCQLRFEIVDIDAAEDVSYTALLERAKTAAGGKAKGFIVFSKDLKEPVLAAPGLGWAILNPDWVTADKDADAEKTNERMGKQFYRALGMAFGAGFRLEKEAVLRAAATPQQLDEALSRNLHPQNLAIIQAVAQSLGIEQRKLKPREELEKMGLIPPRKPKAEEPTAEK